MISQKKGLKLSRNNSQGKQISKAEFNDSLDDFVIAQSLKAARKIGATHPSTVAGEDKPSNSSGCTGVSATIDQVAVNKLSNLEVGNTTDHIIGNSSISTTGNLTPESSSETRKSVDSNVREHTVNPSTNRHSSNGQKTEHKSGLLDSVFVCPLCGRKFVDAVRKENHVGKCAQSKKIDEKTLQRAEELLDRQIAERLSLGLEAIPGKKSSERRPRSKKTDACDISLALALSESLQTANEVARRNEEEILISENLSGVVCELRQEDIAYGGLARVVFQKPEDSTRTKVTKRTKSTKNPRKEYVLNLRTAAERERLIAERAAAILSIPEHDSVHPLEKTPTNRELISDYLNRHHEKARTLWNLTGMVDQLNSADSEKSDPFYVPALRDVLSPAKKKTGYTNILLHVSQLPGRISSQREHSVTISNTQDILEELAIKADGGFFDDTAIEDTRPSATVSSVQGLSDDWSAFVNNPLLSDVKILTKKKFIHAHRLVLAVRCPALMKNLDPVHEGRSFTLDWTDYDQRVAETVVRFIYCGQFSPGEGIDPSEIHRLSHWCNISKLCAMLNRDCDHLNQSELIGRECGDSDCSSIQEVLAPASACSPRVEVKQIGECTEEMTLNEPAEPPEAPAYHIPVHVNDSQRERPTTPDLFDDESIEKVELEDSPKVIEERNETECVDLTQSSGDCNQSPHSSPLPVYLGTPLERTSFSPARNDWENLEVNFEEHVDPAPGVVESPMIPAIERPSISERMGTSFPEMNDSVMWADLDPLSSKMAAVAAPSASSIVSRLVANTPEQQITYSTPEQHRMAKKRKIDVTPQPDYQSMDTPVLQKELDKYGLKPLKRKNAVKLLEHIYEELHPLVTDSESSFQDTPERPTNTTSEDVSQTSSQSDSDKSEVLEESLMIPEDLDDDPGTSQWSNSQQQQQHVPLKKRMKDFLKTRADIQKMILTYEPIEFEWLMKEVHAAKVQCKNRELLDWLDEECITFRMKSKRNAGRSPTKSRKSPGTSPGKRRGCAKKLVG